MTGMRPKVVPSKAPAVWLLLPEQARRRLAAQIARALRAKPNDHAGEADAESPSFG